MKLQDYIQAFIKDWWILAAAVLIGVGGTFFYSYTRPAQYESVASFVASSRLRTTDPGDLINSIDTLTARSGVVTTYCEVLRSQAIIDQATASIGVSPESVLNTYDVSCVVLPDSSVLQLSVRGPSDELVTDLANAIGNVGVQYVSNLQEVYELRRLDTATLPENPVLPNHLIDITLGLILSITAGIALIILRMTLNEVDNTVARSDAPAAS